MTTVMDIIKTLDIATDHIPKSDGELTVSLVVLHCAHVVQYVATDFVFDILVIF